MARSKPTAEDSILASLGGELRAVADEFLSEYKAAAEKKRRPDLEAYVNRVSEAQRAALRETLQDLVDCLDSQKTLTRGKDTTYIHAGTTTRKEFRAPVKPSEETVDLPAPALDSDPDVTIDGSGFGLSDRDFGATIDASATPTDLNRELQFTWGPASDGDEVVRGNFPVVDGYQILGELGRGGMGVVYKARQRGLKRIVALKMILAGGHAGREQLERFRAEAEAVAQLAHPNIVQIFDVGERDGLPFFALEFIDGMALDESIDGEPQTPNRAAEIVEKLALAMDYAHAQGIVHRDLKPANILLMHDGTPKVTDFGLVKRLESDSGQTRTGTIMGTPSFMAPEQARGEREIGPAADTYALGAILYTMLTGRPVFMGPSALDTVMMVIHNEPIPPTRLLPKLPRDIEIICLKCLQKEPGKRYASAGALAEDLRRFQAGEPIQARAVGTAERVWRWARRNPKLATLSTAASLLAVVLMIGGPTAAVLINGQRNQAIAARAEAVENANAARQAETQALEAKADADAARDLADENAKIASTQRRLALTTLNDVVTKVEGELRDRTELNDLRQNVLKLAMDGLERVSRTADTASAADRTIGAAQQRMGDILLRAGKANEARAQYRKALEIFDKLKNAPEADLVQWNTALTHDGLGDVCRVQLEDVKTARDHYEQALSIRQALEKHHNSPQLQPVMIRASLANSYGRIGLLLLEMAGEPSQSAKYSELAIEQSEALRADLPDSAIPKQALAGAWHLYADALLRLGKQKQAADYIQRAMEIRRELLAASPESVKARQDLAITHWMLGDMALFDKHPDLALEQFRAAHAIRMELYQQDQNSTEMQEDLANSFYRLGLAQLSLQDINESKQSFERCKELRTSVLAADPENRMKQLQLLQARARSGIDPLISVEATRLGESLFPSPGTLIKLAGIYATCGQLASENQDATEAEAAGLTAEPFLTTAMELVVRAVENGYRDPFTLSTHPDLAGIRSEAAFSETIELASAEQP
ncbi:MAG: serine/threonine-protein kinase [Pirellulaceae bacterium]